MLTSPDRKITVLLVDDHRLVRESVREILSMEDDLVVVSEAAGSEQAIARTAEHHPDIALLDVEIPGGRPADTVTSMRALSSGTRIIVLSMSDRPALLRRLITAGIRGYLLKSVDRRELVSAIRSVHFSPDRMVLSISPESMAELQGHAQTVLSGREMDVLRLVAEALSNGQIATRLHISEATVKRHLHSVFVKLGAISRIDAVNRAITRSLITPRQVGSAARR